jgi:hypothetical protein
VRATLAWFLTLTSGFAGFMALAIMVLLPIEAAKNRAVYRVVDQYAHRLAETNAFPRNAEEDDAIAPRIEGVSVWPSLPGGCWGASSRAASDRFELGFWDHGSKGAFGSSWWYCYTYPSGKTNLQLSVTDYLATAAGGQVATYVAFAIIAFCLSLWMRSYSGFRDLRLWTKALWFGAFMTIASAFSVLSDFGDDQFYENPDWQKWFVLVFRDTLWPIYERLLFIVDELLPTDGMMYTVLAFAMWSSIGWAAGRLVSVARGRMGTT